MSLSGNPPVDVQQYGQSIWYDNIQRSLIEGGGMDALIKRSGVLGVTSNPAIFYNAIGESDDFDAAMMPLLELEPYEIYERLALEDIQQALDLFLPVYEATNGRDGYVSLEVSPLLAHDTESTLNEARRLFRALDRPNAMIKIPATAAGIPAIEQAIAEGINVNVTLIFAVSNYVQVAEAFVRGLERRLEAGEDVSHVASVASFFLSRIDTAIDRMLENNIRAAQGRDIDRVSANRKLLGKAAIANAKLAYKRFRNLFYGERFARLREAGAQVQRPLWASTSTKNPAYPDTMYIDGLIGRDTVNTVPPAALTAFRDHGTVSESLLDDIEQAETLLDMLAEVGVDLEQITHQLQVDGVEAFIEAFENLLDQVDAKRHVLRTGVIRQQEQVLGTYADAVRAALADMDGRFVNPRIWEKDGSVWKNHNMVINQIRERMGWVDVLETVDRPLLDVLATEARSWSHAVIMGMGSSGVTPEVFSQVFGAAPGQPKVYALDTVDPDYLRWLESQIDLPRTLFLVASKSGKTVETTASFNYFFEKTGRNGAQFMAITEDGSPLAKQAAELGFRQVLPDAVDIGGRYNALSTAGLIPAALLGVDLDRICAEAERMMIACGLNVKAVDHPGMWLGAIMGVLAREGRDKLHIFCSPSIASFAEWIEQLVAPSLGKEGKGIVPVVHATIGNPHDYVTDPLFVYLRVEGDDNDDLDRGIVALQNAGQPYILLRLNDRYGLAGEFFRWQYATAVAGALLEINPFDEPDNKATKTNTDRLLSHQREHGVLPLPDPAFSEGDALFYTDEETLRLLSELVLQHNYSGSDVASMLAAQFNSTRAGDYFAVLAYVPPFEPVGEALRHIRRRLRHVTRRAVTVGFGPRYLHCTGQLHKGGGNNGVFVIVTSENADDLPVPGASYSFSTLKLAQALADAEALRAAGRRVIRLHIRGDVVTGLGKIIDAIELVADRRR